MREFKIGVTSASSGEDCTSYQAGLTAEESMVQVQGG